MQRALQKVLGDCASAAEARKLLAICIECQIHSRGIYIKSQVISTSNVETSDSSHHKNLFSYGWLLPLSLKSNLSWILILTKKVIMKRCSHKTGEIKRGISVAKGFNIRNKTEPQNISESQYWGKDLD